MKKLVVMMICGIFFFGVHPAQAKSKVIKKGSKVTLDYTLTVEGQIIESTEGKNPLEYTHGQGMIIPGLEQALEGLKRKATKKIIIAPEDAYGLRDESRIIEQLKSNLSEEIDIQPGMILQLQTSTGQSISGVIVDTKEDTLTLDFNHPLASKELTFDIKIISIKN